MKYFSLNYSLTPEDYESYYKLIFKSAMSLRLRRIALPLLFMLCIVAYSVYNREYTSIVFYVMVTLISFTGLFYATRGRGKADKDSVYIRKPMTVDFYDDHIVIKNYPDQYTKSHGERHYGFDTVAGIAENEGYFYFLFKSNNILIIPKNVLDEEKNEMIKNLISNLFMKIYRQF